MFPKKASRSKSDGTSTTKRDKTSSKRAKSSQACESCRRHKTRCELLEYNPIPGAPLKCHRCKVLDIECSFENSDVIRVIQRPSPSGSGPPSASTSSSESVYNSRAETFPLAIPALHSQSGSAGTFDGDGLKHAKSPNIIPSPSSHWNVLDVQGGFDWSETPLLAIQELMKLAPMRPLSATILGPHEHLGTILSQDQIISLLDIFDSHYLPWLQLQPRRWGTSPQLDLVRCTVACRHLDPPTRNRVLPRLQKLTEEASLQYIFNPAPSQDFIESILILAAWAPVGAPTSGEARDARLLLGTAINMGINLKLPEMYARSRSGLAKGELDDEGYGARLWQMLEMTETFVCLGSGKSPLSHRIETTIVENWVIDPTRLFSREGSTGLRFEILGKISKLAEAGANLRLESDTLTTFYTRSTEILSKLDCLRRQIEPLPVISTYNPFHFQMGLLRYHASRLLVLHHIIQDVRRVFGSDKQRPWYQLECRGNIVVLDWTHDAIASAESVFVSLLGAKDDNAVMTIPDCLYSMIAFAAAWLVISNFSMHELYNSHLGGSWDRLLATTANRLSSVAPCPDHASARCAHFISSLLGAWGRLTSRTQVTSRIPMAGIPIQPMTIPIIPPSRLSGPTFGTTNRNPLYDTDWQTNSSSNSLTEDEFWHTFMANLTSDTNVIP